MKYFLFFALSLFFPILTKAQAPIENRSNNSEAILEGKIVEQYSIFNKDKTRIYTVNSLLITKIFRGDIETQYVNIITMGGEKDEHSYSAYHSESLYLNQEGIFFINFINNGKKVELNRYLDVSIRPIAYQNSINKICTLGYGIFFSV